MISKRDKAIAELLGEQSNEKAEIDKSLRGQAFRRAENMQPPKTMTPWEWEEWYKQHGMPDEFAEHAKEPASEPKSTPFWKFWAKKPEPKIPPNCARHPDEDSEF